jgi:hypothetical protein
LRRKVPDLRALLKEVAEREGMGQGELIGARRTRVAVKATRLFCQLAVRRFGYTGANVARLLGVTTSLVNRYAALGELLELEQYT